MTDQNPANTASDNALLAALERAGEALLATVERITGGAA